MPRSQNGFAANEQRVVSTHTIPGTDIQIRVRDGDVATVLLYIAGQVNKVEKLNPTGKQWCWGYAERPIRGSATTLSNHASGTAIDLNAPLHPRGVRGTWGLLKKRKIRKILKPFIGVVRWGEDYRSAPCDGMHFEIVGTSAQVAAAAKRIRQNTEDDVTPSDIRAVAQQVLDLKVILNKNGGNKVSLSAMVTDIEDTQDSHTKKLDALANGHTEQSRLLTTHTQQLTQLTQSVNTLINLLAPK